MSPRHALTSLIAAAALCLAATPAVAQSSLAPQLTPAVATDPAACWRGAAQYHGVDMWLLYSIAWVESNMNPTQIGRNRNGSLDLGMMQINTIWLSELSKYGIARNQLMDSCTSIYIGAWIMAKNFRNYGYTWRAIGAYNSGNPAIGYRYAQKVYDAHRRLTGLPTTYYGQQTTAMLIPAKP